MLAAMRRIAALLAFSLIAGMSATALADRAPRRPEPASEETPPEEKPEEAQPEAPPEEPQPEAQPEAPPEEPKADKPAADEKDDKKAEAEKSGSCSVAQEDDAMLALAALVLLTSGLALRRR